jgi:hypothetical protein
MFERATQSLGQLSREERWVYLAIASTFVCYFIGALYLLAPILGWSLILLYSGRFFLKPVSLIGQRTSWIVWLWIAGVVILLLALIIGHVNYGLGIGKTIKSTIGWAKGWALLGIFIFVGSQLKIRADVVIRAACFVGLCALLITPVLVLAYILNIPGYLYVSPLKIFGGSGPEYFTVILYEIDPGSGSPRWRYFAPWAPAVGFVANIYLLCACFERQPLWRLVGIIGNITMIVLSVSRMGMLVMLMVPTAVYFVSRMSRPWVWIVGVIAITLLLIFFEPLTMHVEQVISQLKESRADSTRVREALYDMALYRWYTEAVWFGHGIVERGSHYVEFMPIGSHHNWYGLLFVKGLVGFLAFAIPFGITGIVLFYKSQTNRIAQLGLGLFLILGFFSMSENIESLAYMTWPAWLLIGISLRPDVMGPHSFLNFNKLSKHPRGVSYAA